MNTSRSLVAFFAIACFVLSGCDTFTGSQKNESSRPRAASSTEDQTSATLSFRRWPEGTALPSVPEWKRWKDGGKPSSPLFRKSTPALPDGASPYGCLISTFDPDASPHPYRYDDVYVHYPESVVAAAGDSTRTLTIAYGSKGLFAEQPRSEKIVVRVARCRIPAHSDARRPLIERLHHFNEGNTPAQPEAEEAAVTVSGFLEAMDDSSRSGKSASPPITKNMKEDCSTAIVCVGGYCGEKGEVCRDGGGGFGGGGSSGSGDPGSGDEEGGGGGGGPIPGHGDGDGDGGDSADPCEETRTSLCERIDDGRSGPPPPGSPQGVRDERYDQLNKREKRLCWSSPTQCYYVGQYASWALDWARQVEPTGAHNGPRDAVRHAAWSGRITLAYGAEDAKKWTDAHEWNSSRPDETEMDQYNNRIGRTIGGNVSSLSELKSKIRNYYHGGRLCTSLSNC